MDSKRALPDHKSPARSGDLHTGTTGQARFTKIRHTIIKIKTLNYDGVPGPGKTGHKKGHTGRGFREKFSGIFRFARQQQDRLLQKPN